MGNTSAQVVTRPSEVHSLLGVEHRIVLSGSDTDGAVAVVEITIPPGGGSPPHTNTNESLYWYVIEGSVDFERGGEPVRVEAGGGISTAKGTPHLFVNGTDRRARVVMVATPAGGEGFFRDAAAVLPPVVPDGPRPAEAIAALAEVAGRYGIELHLPPAGG